MSDAASYHQSMPYLPRLKEIRTSRLLTQAELAEKTGLAVQTVSRIENGMNAEFRTTRKLAAALGVEPEELIGEEQQEATA